MDDESKDRNLEAYIRLFFFQPVPEHQDGDCPHIEWMGEDLNHCPGVGEYKCRIRTYRYGEYDQNMDYCPCVSDNYKTCWAYLERKKKSDGG
jgi:hypothetical protein